MACLILKFGKDNLALIPRAKIKLIQWHIDFILEDNHGCHTAQ
jgi:hypothetical protein